MRVVTGYPSCQTCVFFGFIGLSHLVRCCSTVRCLHNPQIAPMILTTCHTPLMRLLPLFLCKQHARNAQAPGASLTARLRRTASVWQRPGRVAPSLYSPCCEYHVAVTSAWPSVIPGAFCGGLDFLEHLSEALLRIFTASTLGNCPQFAWACSLLGIPSLLPNDPAYVNASESISLELLGFSFHNHARTMCMQPRTT